MGIRGARHDDTRQRDRTARPARSPRSGRRRRLTEGDIAGLVDRAKDGNREAFGILYTEYRPSIFSLARFSLSDDAAEDAVGETFVRAWEALPRYRRTGAPFAAWLYGIARHVVVDAVRKSARVELRSDAGEDVLDVDDSSVDRLLVGDAIRQLPEEQRAVIEMKFLAGLSNEEIGRALCKTPGAVNTQQWRALGALRRILEDT